MRAVQYFTISALAFASPAIAQAPTDKVKLEVTRAELQIIGQGVRELPYKISAPVLNDLQAQLTASDQAAKAAAEKPIDKPAEAAPAPAEQPKQ